MAIAAATMARDGDEPPPEQNPLRDGGRLPEPGELAPFIDEAEVDFLEDVMSDRGFLDSRQMGGAFQPSSRSKAQDRAAGRAPFDLN